MGGAPGDFGWNRCDWRWTITRGLAPSLFREGSGPDAARARLPSQGTPPGYFAQTPRSSGTEPPGYPARPFKDSLTSSGIFDHLMPRRKLKEYDLPLPL